MLARFVQKKRFCDASLSDMLLQRQGFHGAGQLVRSLELAVSSCLWWSGECLRVRYVRASWSKSFFLLLIDFRRQEGPREAPLPPPAAVEAEPTSAGF